MHFTRQPKAVPHAPHYRAIIHFASFVRGVSVESCVLCQSLYLLGQFDWFLHRNTQQTPRLIVSKCTWSGVHALFLSLSLALAVGWLKRTFAPCAKYLAYLLKANVINAYVVESDPQKPWRDEPMNKTNRQFVIIVRVIWCNESTANCISHKSLRSLWPLFIARTILFVCSFLYQSFASFICRL